MTYHHCSQCSTCRNVCQAKLIHTQKSFYGPEAATRSWRESVGPTFSFVWRLCGSFCFYIHSTIFYRADIPDPGRVGGSGCYRSVSVYGGGGVECFDHRTDVCRFPGICLCVCFCDVCRRARAHSSKKLKLRVVRSFFIYSYGLSTVFCSRMLRAAVRAMSSFSRSSLLWASSQHVSAHSAPTPSSANIRRKRSFVM